MKKPINTRLHGYLDYSVGGLLIAAPWIFSFARGGAETWIFVAAGAAAWVYSLITDYELGVRPLISIRTHLGLDIASGVLLVSSPWLFGFAEHVYIPHVLFGLLEILAASLTQRPHRHVVDPTATMR